MADIDMLLEDLKSFQTRSGARKALVKLGPEQAGGRLQDLLKKECPENVVWSIVDIFTAWQWRESADQLVGLLDVYPSLQMDISRALTSITGLELEPDADLWRRMLESPGIFIDLKKAFPDLENARCVIYDSYCSVVVPLERSRRQEVLVYEKIEKLTLYTECGVIAALQVKHVEKFNEELSWAELLVEEANGEMKVTMTAEVSQGDISADKLKLHILKIAELADSLEEQLTGKDKI